MATAGPADVPLAGEYGAQLFQVVDPLRALAQRPYIERYAGAQHTIFTARGLERIERAAPARRQGLPGGLHQGRSPALRCMCL
jgi:hypothetical protein